MTKTQIAAIRKHQIAVLADLVDQYLQSGLSGRSYGRMCRLHRLYKNERLTAVYAAADLAAAQN